MYTTDLRAELTRIKTPALVIGTWVGLQQYTTRAKIEQNFREQYSALRGYKLVIAEKAKHFVMLDDLKFFIREVNDFLAAQARRRDKM